MILTRQHKIQINNIDIIVDKINKFVWYYAKKKNLGQWVYTIQFEFLYQIDIFPDNSPIYKSYLCELCQIDYEREFYNANFDYVYNNSPFVQNKPTMRTAIESYLRMYHEEYAEIEKFINKLLYLTPNKLVEEDFNKLNELYNKIKSDGVSNANSMINGW